MSNVEGTYGFGAYGDSTYGFVIRTLALPAQGNEWRAFVVRRTTGGDVVRAPEGGFRSALRYGAGTVTPDEVAGTNLIVYPRRYDSMVITVQIPTTIHWTQAVLVRGGFGAPTTPQDGVVLWYTQSSSPPEDVSHQVLDTPLTPGNWYYYSLFLWVENQWVLVHEMDNLVPNEHGWADFLFRTIPMFYQRTDDMQAADGRNGPLRVFSKVLGYELDYSNSLVDGVRDVFNVDRAPARLLKYLGNNFGVPDEAVLGDTRSRSMLQQLDDLNSLRGTTAGLQQLVEAATHYTCDVVTSGNQLLSVDDGDFNGGDVSQYGMTPLLSSDLSWGIGHWTVTTNPTILSKLEDPINQGTFASSHTVSTAILAKNLDTRAVLIPPGGVGSMVVNGPGPDIVVVCGTVLNNTSALYAIPVTVGAIYEVSAQVERSTWSATPPAARLVLGILWFDAAGTLLSASTGPLPPNVTDSGVWQKVTMSAAAPDSAAYGMPVIWWIGSSVWGGASGTPTVRPTTGHFVSMVSFTLVANSGSALTPLGADVYLTLGATAKTLGSAQSILGNPGRTN